MDSLYPIYPILKTTPKAQQARTDQLKLVDVVADVDIDIGTEESFGNGLESVWQLISHR